MWPNLGHQPSEKRLFLATVFAPFPPARPFSSLEVVFLITLNLNPTLKVHLLFDLYGRSRKTTRSKENGDWKNMTIQINFVHIICCTKTSFFGSSSFDQIWLLEDMGHQCTGFQWYSSDVRYSQSLSVFQDYNQVYCFLDLLYRLIFRSIYMCHALMYLLPLGV